ncbi:hypothetical protein [Nocardia sp. NPDC051570]|uniref:hypothetical protein n=1 Tax=Nocardia sp. NPDC051570 TaxID=3364324 RepID=UPI00379FB1E2
MVGIDEKIADTRRLAAMTNLNNDREQFDRKNYRIPVAFDDYFRAGLYQIGPVVPDTEYSGDPNRPGPQKRDPVTGLLVWKLPVMDRAESNTRRASYDVLLLSDTEPVPTTQEIAPGYRPIALEDVTIQPRIAGQGEYKFIQNTVRANGFAAPPATGGRSASSGGVKNAG